MLYLFAAEEAEASGIGALGVNFGAFLIQVVTFVIIFFLLKKYAFKPIVKLLSERRKVIDDGVRLGQKMEHERELMQQESAKVIADARHEADKIIARGHKEVREMQREAEKSAHAKAERMIAEAEIRIHEEEQRAKRKLEKDIVNMVSDATEAIVDEKVDATKDKAIIDNALKGRS